MVLTLHRLSHLLYRLRVPVLPKAIYALNRVVFGVALPASTTIGKRVVLGYMGLGTVIHARAVIGDRVVIGPNVTIGGRSGLREVPIIDADVFIGAGARILGPVRVGRGAVVGANAVVVKDVPENAVVAGVPAKILRIGNVGEIRAHDDV